VEHLHEIHHVARQHLEVASNRMKACYDQLANLAGFQEGNIVAVLPHLKDKKIKHAADVLGRPLHHHPDRRNGFGRIPGQ